jgi:hypothetical protein
MPPPVFETANDVAEVLEEPENGSVRPPPPPPELAMVSVDPDGVIVTFDPAASVTASWRPLTLLTTWPEATLPA